MGKQKKSFRSEIRERAKLILEADKLASIAARHGKRAVERKLRGLWGAAAFRHKQAAIGYRKAGLGLLAREQWLGCAAACEAMGCTEEAATCRQEAKAIPAYWEEVK
jgi:hypothetical protein